MELLTKVKSASHKAVESTKSVTHKVADPVVNVGVKRLAIHKRKAQINDILAMEGLVIIAQERVQKTVAAEAKESAKAAAKAAKEAAKVEEALANPPKGNPVVV